MTTRRRVIRRRHRDADELPQREDFPSWQDWHHALFWRLWELGRIAEWREAAALREGDDWSHDLH